MLVYITLVFFVCLTSWLIQKNDFSFVITRLNKKHRCDNKMLNVFFCFFILSAFSIFRDGIGIDYDAYYEHIRLIQSGSPHYMEIGFQYLVRVVARYSTNPRWVISIMSFFTCLFYLLAIYKMSSDFSFSIFIFLTWGYYFLSFNTVRNYFAYSLALFSIFFLFEKKYTKFFLCIIIATLFHKSALVCIPLYLFAQRDFNKKYVMIIVILITLAFIFQKPLKNLVFMFYPSYRGSVYDTEKVSWLNILKAMIVILIGVIFYEQVRKNILNRLCFNLNILSLVFYIGFYWIPEMSRIGFYLNTSAIILVPRLLSNFRKDNQNMLIVKISVIVGSCVLFYLLMRGWYSSTINLLPYKTWLGGAF